MKVNRVYRFIRVTNNSADNVQWRFIAVILFVKYIDKENCSSENNN